MVAVLPYQTGTACLQPLALHQKYQTVLLDKSQPNHTAMHTSSSTVPIRLCGSRERNRHIELFRWVALMLKRLFCAGKLSDSIISSSSAPLVGGTSRIYWNDGLKIGGRRTIAAAGISLDLISNP
jgi:hypothetical protein